MQTLRDEKLRVLRAARRGKSLIPCFDGDDGLILRTIRASRLIKRRDAALARYERRARR